MEEKRKGNVEHGFVNDIIDSREEAEKKEKKTKILLGDDGAQINVMGDL